MSTIATKHIVDEIIAGDGYYQSDPRAVLIVEYETAWGGTAWGVSWEFESPERQHRYLIETDHVRNPHVVWRAES